MAEQENPLTDAEWAAREAARAFAQGRYALGCSFGRIAALAHANDMSERAATAQTELFGTPAADRTRVVPLIGSTRQEQPRRPYTTTYQDQQTEIINTSGSHAPSRCTATTIRNGHQVECFQPIGYDVDNETWYHIDASADDHLVVKAP